MHKKAGTCILVFFMTVLNPAFSQQPDTIVIQRNDTIIKLVRPGTSTKELNGKKIEEILEDNSERSFFSRKLHEWLVKSSMDNEPTPPENLTENLAEHRGKRIVNIDIRHIPPFGGSVEDTMVVTDSWLGRMGNRLRFETAPDIIRKTITFQEHNQVSPTDIYDSERLLRALTFINDARIRVWPASADGERVNISIYVQDRYPHAVSAGMNNEQPSLSLINKNLLGRGLSLSHTLVVPSPDFKEWGFREILGAENFLGQYIDLEIDYSKTRNLHLIAGKMEKEFVLPEIKYAGGLQLNRSFTNSRINDYPPIEWEPPLDFRRQNLWLGRSFQIGTSESPLRSNFYITSRYLDLDLFNKNEASGFIPEGEFYYGGLAFSRRGYYKNNLIHSFGRTEDVPHGSLGQISYGVHKDRQLTRHFLGLHYSFGKALIPSRGFFFFSSDIGSFFNTGSPEQGHLKLSSEYITPLIPLGQSKLRNFLELEYANGLNRFSGEYLFIDENANGLHSFDYSETIKGSEKIVLKTEQVLFTRAEPLGFKFAVFSFFDTALLRENKDKSLFRQAPYFSFGGGLRIRNDNLVFNTLQIRLAIMPRVPSGEFPISLRITGESPRKFRDFVPSPPGSPVYF
ncbi:MAG: hypothetical protein R6U46_11965 [Marinilabilia sp.]